MLTHLWRSLIAFRTHPRPDYGACSLSDFGLGIPGSGKVKIGGDKDFVIKIDGRSCADLRHALQLAAYQDQLDAARLHRAMADASKCDQEALQAMIDTLKAMLEIRKVSA